MSLCSKPSSAHPSHLKLHCVRAQMLTRLLRSTSKHKQQHGVEMCMGFCSNRLTWTLGHPMAKMPNAICSAAMAHRATGASSTATLSNFTCCSGSFPAWHRNASMNAAACPSVRSRSAEIAFSLRCSMNFQPAAGSSAQAEEPCSQ